MFTVASKSISRPDERRRNPRHRSSSLIYVQLGSDNGGIVTNLGVDGVAFQAARKLTEENNSTLNLRLRGSGIDANLVGELVWLGTTKKEAGICFKEIPTEVHQGIADWIAREAHSADARPAMDRSRPKPMAAMNVVPVAREKSVSHSISAAIAMAQAAAAKLSPASTDNAAAMPSGDIAMDSPAMISAAPPPEIVSPIEQSSHSSNPSEFGSQSQRLDLGMLSAQVQVEPPLQSQPVSEIPDPPQVEKSSQSETLNLYPRVLYQPTKPASIEEIPQASREVKVESGPLALKAKEVEIKTGDPISKTPGEAVKSTPLDKWVPPTLLAAWRRATRQQRLALAGMAVGCIWIFGLILILAVTHIASPSSASAGSGSLQMSQVRPSSKPEAGSHQVAAGQETQVATEETEDGQPPPPPPTLLSRFGDYVFGTKPEKPVELWRRPQIKIDPNLIGVQVWTSKESGYYYCADSPFYMTLQPGATMNQRDALQNGYQPILGQFCN